MKRKLLSFGLLAAGLLTAGNAFADAGDVTTNADIDFSNAISSSTTDGTTTYSIAGTVGSMTWTGQWTATPTVENGILRVGNFTGTVDLVNFNPGTKDVVTATFQVRHIGLSGKTFGWGFLDSDGNAIVEEKYVPYNSKTAYTANSFGMSHSDFAVTSSTSPGWSDDYATTFTVTFDYKNQTITLNTACAKATNTKNTYTLSMSANEQYSKTIKSFYVYSNYNNADRKCYFDNLKITTTVGDYDAQEVNYTVKFVDADDNAISGMEDESKTADSGDAIEAALASYQVTSYSDDESQKYVYNSWSAVDANGEAATTFSEGTVVTVKYDVYSKYKATLNLSYGSTTTAYKTSELYEDETVKLYYPVCVKDGDTYYLIARNSAAPYYGFEFSSTNAEQTATYTADTEGNIVYYGEWATNATSEGDASDGSYIGYMDKGTYVSTDELPAGIYSIELNVLDRKAGGGSTYVCAYDASGNALIESIDCKNNAGVKTGSFTLYSASIVNVGLSTGNSGSFDYVIIRKTGDVETIEVECTNADKLMCTYSNLTQDLVFPEDGDVKAYVADEYNEKTDEVHMTQITSVPKGTGVVLTATSADARTVKATVADGLSFSGTNYMKATTGETVPVNEDTYYNYILANDGLFYYLESDYALPTGYAYLHLERTPSDLSSGAKALKLVFDDEQATGINSVNAAATNGKVYNLQGIEVQNPTNGLYIKNGKKYIK